MIERRLPSLGVLALAALVTTAGAASAQDSSAPAPAARAPATPARSLSGRASAGPGARGLAAAQDAYQVRLDLFDNGRATTLEVSAAETATIATISGSFSRSCERTCATTRVSLR